MQYDISVVTLNYNTRDLLASCLASLLEFNDRLNLELIVVDNASSDGSAQMVRERFPEVLLVENTENLGCARGGNRGMEIASAPFVLYLNADVEARPGAIRVMLEYLQTRPDVGIVGPRLIGEDGEYQQSCHYFTLLKARSALLLFLTLIGSRGWRHLGLSTNPSLDGWQQAEVDWIYTACVLIRREVLDSAGLLDAHMFFGGDDMDFCYRAARAGWKTVYLPQAEITHHGNQSGVQVFGNVHGIARARTRIAALDYFQRKHFTAAHSYVMRSILGVGSLAISLMMRAVLLFDRHNQVAATRATHSWNTARACLESMFGKGPAYPLV